MKCGGRGCLGGDESDCCRVRRHGCIAPQYGRKRCAVPILVCTYNRYLITYIRWVVT